MTEQVKTRRGPKGPRLTPEDKRKRIDMRFRVGTIDAIGTLAESAGMNRTSVVDEAISLLLQSSGSIPTEQSGAGIYAVVNRETGGVYIGSCLNIQSEWAQHRSMLIDRNHHCVSLQDAFHESDASVFDFVVIESCDPKILLVRERFWQSILLRLIGDQCYNKGPSLISR